MVGVLDIQITERKFHWTVETRDNARAELLIVLY